MVFSPLGFSYFLITLPTRKDVWFIPTSVLYTNAIKLLNNFNLSSELKRENINTSEKVKSILKEIIVVKELFVSNKQGLKILKKVKFHFTLFSGYVQISGISNDQIRKMRNPQIK